MMNASILLEYLSIKKVSILLLKYDNWVLFPPLKLIASSLLVSFLKTHLMRKPEVPPIGPLPPMGFEKEMRRADERRMTLRYSLSEAEALQSGNMSSNNILYTHNYFPFLKCYTLYVAQAEIKPTTSTMFKPIDQPRNNALH
jgi:hypothetical protein